MQSYYQNEGYVRARVGQPELKVLEDSKDGKERWIQLRIPVTEGHRYRIGEFNIEGNTVVKTEALRPLFKVRQGDWYNAEGCRRRPAQGAGDLRQRRVHGLHRLPGPEAE